MALQRNIKRGATTRSKQNNSLGRRWRTRQTFRSMLNACAHARDKRQAGDAAAGVSGMASGVSIARGVTNSVRAASPRSKHNKRQRHHLWQHDGKQNMWRGVASMTWRWRGRDASRRAMPT